MVVLGCGSVDSLVLRSSRALLRLQQRGDPRCASRSAAHKPHSLDDWVAGPL